MTDESKINSIKKKNIKVRKMFYFLLLLSLFVKSESPQMKRFVRRDKPLIAGYRVSSRAGCTWDICVILLVLSLFYLHHPVVHCTVSYISLTSVY